MEPQEANNAVRMIEENKEQEMKQSLVAVVEEYLEVKNAVSDRMEQDLADV